MKHFPELQLTPVSARVLGCLLEKQITTPDLYPLTLNSLVTACNQSSSRHPVTNYSADDVTEAIRLLSEDYLVTKVLGGRAPKYEHELGDVLDLTDQERAILTVLLLRDPAEDSLPGAGFIRGREVESGREFTISSKKQFTSLADKTAELKGSSIDHFAIQTDQPFLAQLRLFLQSRNLLSQ